MPKHGGSFVAYASFTALFFSVLVPKGAEHEQPRQLF